MSFKVRITTDFERAAKPLKSKYPSFLQDIVELGQQLAEQPTLGAPLGGGLYKVRLAIRSKGKGKSCGAQVITAVFLFKQEVYLLFIFDKSERENLEPNELLLLRNLAQQIASKT